MERLAAETAEEREARLVGLKAAQQEILAAEKGRRQTIRGPTYSMATAIGATVWQEGSICQCQSLITWTDLSNGHSYSMS